MQLSPGGVHLIASFEGFVPTPYNDATGAATIGYGHLLHEGNVTTQDQHRDYVAEFGLTGPSVAGRLSEAQGLELLAKDTTATAAAVSAAVKVRLGILPGRAPARFAALTSFAFNIGSGAFDSSHVLELVNQHGAPRDWTPVATAMLAWDHGNRGVVLPGLLTRRKDEGEILISGKLPAV